jgi:hypothetical protein
MVDKIGNKEEQTGSCHCRPYRQDKKNYPPGKLALHSFAQPGLQKADQSADEYHRMGKPAWVAKKPVEDHSGGDYIVFRN